MMLHSLSIMIWMSNRSSNEMKSMININKRCFCKQTTAITTGTYIGKESCRIIESRARHNHNWLQVTNGFPDHSASHPFPFHSASQFWPDHLDSQSRSDLDSQSYPGHSESYSRPRPAASTLEKGTGERRRLSSGSAQSARLTRYRFCFCLPYCGIAVAHVAVSLVLSLITLCLNQSSWLVKYVSPYPQSVSIIHTKIFHRYR